MIVGIDLLFGNTGKSCDYALAEAMNGQYMADSVDRSNPSPPWPTCSHAPGPG